MQKVHDNVIMKPHRKYLRTNMTEEERILWSQIKDKKLGHKFRRQHSISGYVVDFYCAKRKLIIELDGNQHLDNREYDLKRTEYLNSLGYVVARFWNGFVRSNLRDVLMEIEDKLRNQ